MYYRITGLLIILSAFLLAQNSVAGVDMKNGLWEITTKMEMPGMPMEMPAVTFTQCLTSRNNVPRSAEQNQDCAIKSSQVRGNTVSWEMQCVNNGETTNGSGKITYNGNTFTGGMTIETDGMRMTQHMSGRRIGECE